MEDRRFSVGDKVRYIYLPNYEFTVTMVNGLNWTSVTGFDYYIHSGDLNLYGERIAGTCFESDLELIESLQPSYDYIPTQEAEEDDI